MGNNERCGEPFTDKRDKIIVRTSVVGIVTNVLLAAFKAAVGLASHSIAVVLDAVNNLSDALSSIIETPSWGFDGPDFLNCVVRYRTARRPETLLKICKRIERAMGRRGELEYDAEGRRIYRDRPIDIDILLCGDERVDTPELQIPHPLMHEREFVMRPLAEIFPQK